MTLRIDFGVEGLNEAMEILSSMGANLEYKSVELQPVAREETEFSNAEILQSLADTGRNFKAMTSATSSKIERAAIEEWRRRLENEVAKANRKAKAAARAQGKATGMSGRLLTKFVAANTKAASKITVNDQWWRQCQGAMLKKAMEAYMEDVAYGIEIQEAPGGVAPLSEDYAEYKKRTFGFEEPIGKASGQLIANLDASISSPHIKLKK